MRFSANCELSDLTVLSLGLGQDSSAILAKMLTDGEFREEYAPGKLLVVSSDTGNEHDHTYEHKRKIEALCAGREDVEYAFLEAGDRYHMDSWNDVLEPQLRGPEDEYDATMVQLGTKSCTDNLKIHPIYLFLDEWINDRMDYGYSVRDDGGCRKHAIKRFHREEGKIRILIGYDGEEVDRAQTTKAAEQEDYASDRDVWEKALYREFPLLDHDVDQDEARRINEDFYGYDVWPSNCMLCPYQSDAEIEWLRRNREDMADLWVEIERRKLDRDASDNSKGVFLSDETVRERLDRVADEFDDMNDDELDEIKKSRGCPTNTF